MNRRMIVEIKIVEPTHKNCDVQIPEQSLALVHDEVHIMDHMEPAETCQRCGQGKIPEKKVYFCRGPQNNVSGGSEAEALANYCQSVLNYQLSMSGR